MASASTRSISTSMIPNCAQTRHLTRWLQEDGDPAHLAKFSGALLTALRGSLCIFQGEELGLPKADLALKDLTDPYDIRFWPAYKGRDGCRTPMVWEADNAEASFTTDSPWLPVFSANLAVDTQNDGSTLAAYRKTLSFRAAHATMQSGANTIP